MLNPRIAVAAAIALASLDYLPYDRPAPRDRNSYKNIKHKKGRTKAKSHRGGKRKR